MKSRDIVSLLLIAILRLILSTCASIYAIGIKKSIILPPLILYRELKFIDAYLRPVPVTLGLYDVYCPAVREAL